ncbi:Fe-S cluster assembly protein HesB [Bacillus sp. M6-12]|uniref:3-hexulose-6-phosphate synthase n=1 Tax=Bacillus sp. M6-12 TaxID=2054166 RepID=UPI000C793DEC|nr:3-hexulose-6-phosphate synthase [Bacillus sp. M6-12]PLS17712.1 Fe-S cluster assembly protein HesB [Bacillus sp. M6-12]
MYLQLALDRLTKEQCFELTELTERSVDIVELGTGVIKQYGISIVREMKQAFPEKIILADMKTCDAGKHEAVQAFEAGADITTVMGFSADQTILDMLEVASQNGKRIMVDLLGVTDKKRIQEISELKADLVSLHYGKDMQQKSAVNGDAFKLLEDFKQLQVSVAGGITVESLPSIIEKQPDIIIVGSAITKAADPQKTAAEIKELMY